MCLKRNTPVFQHSILHDEAQRAFARFERIGLGLRRLVEMTLALIFLEHLLSAFSLGRFGFLGLFGFLARALGLLLQRIDALLQAL